MTRVSTRASGVPAVGELLLLSDPHADSRVEIAPARGAIVTSFSVRGRELLYLDSGTLSDPEKNVRGGIPVLFPAPGKLLDDRYEHGGRTLPMKQHGFARTLPWAVVDSAADGDRASARLSLSANEQTLAQYPWQFELSLTFTLVQTRLTIAIALVNRSESPMPFAFGFHPYFAVSDKAQATIHSAASRAFDNVTKAVVPFTGFDFKAPELDLHLIDHGSSACALRFADGARIELRASPEFGRWIIWTVAGKDYICLEPWSAPLNALNSGEELLHVPPGGRYEGFVELAFHD